MNQFEHDEEELFLYNGSNSFPAVDNHNIKDEKVILLDISSNKEWMAYVTCKRANPSCVFLTVRKFTAVSEYYGKKEISIEDGEQVVATEGAHLSRDISGFMGDKPGYCKFLSISKNGKYVALSFYDSSVTMENRESPNYYIFEVQDRDIKVLHSDKFSGRAVFSNDKKDSLYLVDANSIRYYDFPCKSFKATVFDLNIFGPVLPKFHHSYIESSPWLNLSYENDDIKKIVTFTRHIRQNILTTPFEAIRIWSLTKKCVLWSSINAEEQHIMAFSKSNKITAADNEIENNKLAAAYNERDQIVNVYNVKNGLLVYNLKLQNGASNGVFRISHMCFCFDNRYLAISGWENNNAVFEVWYLYSEKHIYRKSKNMGDSSDNLMKLKVFEPFIMQNRSTAGESYLTGFYMSKNGTRLETNFSYLSIDLDTDTRSLTWTKKEINKVCGDYNEIDDSLLNFENIKCAYINIEGESHIIRFGKHTIQFWKVSRSSKSGDPIQDNDELIYIRAYKGPDYGLKYSFRETWRICDYDSIKFTEGKGSRRLLVNIMKTSYEFCKDSHREEIFLTSDDSHKFESACQALHYLCNIKGYNNEKNMVQLRKKTQKLIELASISFGPESTYFINIAGNRTLAMLASFEEGRKIIAMIIAKPVQISIYSYSQPSPETPMKKSREFEEAIRNWENLKERSILNGKAFFRKGEKGSETSSREVLAKNGDRSMTEISLIDHCESTNVSYQTNGAGNIVRKENVLTVLVDNSSYDLFKLLFNRVLSDSQFLGTGGLSVLTDVILYLQEADSDLLLPSIKKLSYLRISEKALGLLGPELKAYKASYAFYNKDVVDIANLEPYAIKEELKSYTEAEWNILKRNETSYIRILIDSLLSVKTIINHFTWNKLREISKEKMTTSLQVCIISLQHFSLYGNQEQSSFIQKVLNRRSNDIFKQKDTVFEISLEYKWKKFARRKFILICFIHALYYVSYLTGVLFSRVLYVKGTENEFDMNHPGHIMSLIIMGVSFSVLAIQEFRQFNNTPNKMHYILSGYNWVDLAGFVFPAFTVLQSLLGWDHFVEVCSVTNLILWSHGILRLRVISHFGFALEIIIQLFNRVFVTLCIMFLFIIAFTISFVILLSSKGNEFFQDNSSGSFTSTTNLTEGTVDIFNVSSSNGFVSWFKAFSNVWLFIYGVWDPVTQGEAGDSQIVMLMCILFSCTIMLLFVNVIIALMASTVEEVRKLGRKAWVGHFAFVVSEIELLWCTRAESTNRINNPSFIYYVAKEETIRKQEDELQEETEMLCRKLNIRPEVPQAIRY